MENSLKQYVFGDRIDSETYIKHLREIGVTIGEGTMICAPTDKHVDVYVDEHRPYLITIGKNCRISKGVVILTHSGDWFVSQHMFGDVAGEVDEVVIGDNVFIGMNSIVLKGVHIGDNVIVGANTVVYKDLESGYVYAGNPVKKICTLDEHRKKTQSAQLKEAFNIYKNYVRVFNAEPPMSEFREFAFLFCERNKPIPKVVEDALVKYCQNSIQLSYEQFLKTKPLFNGFDEFLQWCRNQ